MGTRMKHTRKVRLARNTVNHFQKRFALSLTEEKRLVTRQRYMRAVALLVAEELARIQ